MPYDTLASQILLSLPSKTLFCMHLWYANIISHFERVTHMTPVCQQYLHVLHCLFVFSQQLFSALQLMQTNILLFPPSAFAYGATRGQQPRSHLSRSQRLPTTRRRLRYVRFRRARVQGEPQLATTYDATAPTTDATAPTLATTTVYDKPLWHRHHLRARHHYAGHQHRKHPPPTQTPTTTTTYDSTTAYTTTALRRHFRSHGSHR